MNAYICSVCGYLYDAESAEKNIENKPVPFEELAEEWVCPDCGVSQDLFHKTESDRTPDMSTSRK